MWTVWRISGLNPYCIYHDLDADFVPIEGGERMPPPYPSRLQQVLYAFGEFEYKHTARMAGAKFPEDAKRKKPPQRQEG